MNIEAKKIVLIEKIISIANEGLLDAILSAVSKSEIQESEAENYPISEDVLNKMADLAENDLEQKNYTKAANLLREIDNW